MKTFAISALLVALAGGGCISSSDDDLVFEADDGKADSTRPFGRFERQLEQGEAGFTLLQLDENKTYEASQELVTCKPGACTDAFSGKFRWAGSSGKKYVVLYNGDDWWYSFEYKLAGDALSLRDKGGSEWFSLNRAAAAGLELDAGDAGGHFQVTEGESIVLRLSANPTTGYEWKVTATDRTFGYPTTSFTPDSGATGSGGVETFTWKTSGPLSMVGSHSVTLEYKRSWETTAPPANLFQFTVDVVSAR